MVTEIDAGVREYMAQFPFWWQQDALDADAQNLGTLAAERARWGDRGWHNADFLAEYLAEIGEEITDAAQEIAQAAQPQDAGPRMPVMVAAGHVAEAVAQWRDK